MLTQFRTIIGGLLLVSILCLAAASQSLAAPLTAAWHAATTPTNETLDAATSPTAAAGDTGISGAWRAQPLATPLDVIFVDPLHGWSRDATQRTTDGGRIWRPAYVPGPAWPNVAAFVSPTEGWVGGNTFVDELCHEFIDHTTDGGVTWSRQYTSPARYGGASQLTWLHFVDNRYGWGYGYTAMEGRLSVRTTDGGSTWRPSSIGIINGSWMKMLDRTRWFRLNTPYRLSKTTDAGNTWSEVGRLPGWAILPSYLTDYHRGGPYIAPDGRFMIVVGEAGRIARSTDGGLTWVEVPLPSTDDLSWVALADDSAGWAAGANGAVLHTNNGGLAWTRQQISTTHSVAWLAAFNPNDALLRAERLYRTSDGGIHWLPLPTGSVEAPQAGVRPTIDGNLWEWQALPATHLDRANASSITGSEIDPSPADLSADLRSAWRSSVLYFAVAVTDDVLVGSQSVRPWYDDAIELSLHVPAKGKTHQFTIGLDGRQFDNRFAITSLAVFTRTVPGGWTLEAVIPAWVLGLDALVAGQEYPFTFALWDDDLRTNSDHTHMIWRGTDTFTYQPAWGTLRPQQHHLRLPDRRDPDAHPHADGHSEPHCFGYAFPYAHRHAHVDGFSHAHRGTDCHAFTDVHDYCHSDCHAFTDSTITATATATPSATSTASATPSRTPTATPATGDIAGAAWLDADGDGVRDAAELGLVGVRIELVQDGAIMRTDTTGGDGAYRFAALPPGTYLVREHQPDWLRWSTTPDEVTVVLAAGETLYRRLRRLEREAHLPAADPALIESQGPQT